MKAFVGLLLLVGFVCVYWKLVVLGLVLWAVVKAVPIAYREHRTQQALRSRERAEIAARADRQRVWFESGDPRWLTGERMQG